MMNPLRPALTIGLAVLFSLTVPHAVCAQTPRLELEKGDHISIVGNTLAERMRHFGYLEALIQARFPEYELTFRNLGWSADEVATRPRVQGFGTGAALAEGYPFPHNDLTDTPAPDSARQQQPRFPGYGTPDAWLFANDTDVLFAFFGFNESFEGQAGLDEFRKSLVELIEHTRSQKYDGEHPPRLVLFSPIAHENLRDPDLPSGKENNERLKRYTQAMAEVAAAHDVTFVNLFEASRQLYAQSSKPLTFNGVHLTGYGYKKLAPAIDAVLFGEREEEIEWSDLETLRQAVLDKNFYWFHRYHVTDGNNVYGGRSYLTYTNGISNREVLQRELEVLDVMTANRDKRIWAIAQGGEYYKITDRNTPPFISVETNKPGSLPGGEYAYLSGEEAIEKMTVHEGMEVNLFASEQMFPVLTNPVQMAFDTQGRLWVATWATYPHWKPKSPMDDKLLILKDTDGDGRADDVTVFADHLNNPTGFEFYNGGVLVALAPDLVFLKDTDGDDHADVRKRILHGLSSGDTHHTANSFVFGPGGGLFFSEGVFHRTSVETPYGPVRNRDAAIWRFEPRTYRLQRWIPYGFANPHGHVFTSWGQGIVTDATGADPYHATLFSGYLPYPEDHSSDVPQIYQEWTRPLPAVGLLSSRHFPDSLQGNLLVANVIGFRGILQYDVEQKGSSLVATEVDPIVRSSDPKFRPVDIEMGPDGAIYFLDWQDPLIGHMQHHIRDPSRDHSHGRIYRITYPSRPLLHPPTIDGQPIPELLDLLKRPENRYRYRVKIELSERDTDRVIAALGEWIKTLDQGDPRYPHHLLEALWVHQWHNVVNEDLLRRLLRSPNYHARAAATQVLSHWRRRVDRPLALLEKQVNDEHPLVRLEAVRALSFFKTVEAAEIALQALRHEMDKYLEYTLGETMRALTPYWKPALQQGEPFAEDNLAGLRYLLDHVGAEALVNMPMTPEVARELLSRPDIPLENRRAALEALAESEGSAPLEVLVEVLQRSGAAPSADATADLLDILGDYDHQELRSYADRFLELITGGDASAAHRATGYAALIIADGSAERAWRHASQSLRGLRAFLEGVTMLQDEQRQASLYPRVRSLMFALPELLSGEAGRERRKGLRVAYYDRAVPNAKRSSFADLTPATVLRTDQINLYYLEPVEQGPDAFSLLFTGVIDIPATGRYTFYTTSDGDSRLYIDGETVVVNDGRHGPEPASGTVHLAEGPHPITMTYVGRRRGGQTLNASWEGPGFSQRPLSSDVLSIGSGEAVQQAAILLLAELPHDPAETFRDLARLIRGGGEHVLPAVDAIRTIDEAYWQDDQAAAMAEAIIELGRQMSTSERSEPRFRTALAFARELAARMPEAEAQSIRDALGALAVKVVRITTVPGKIRYDLTEFTVQAGQSVKIVFVNDGLMPHNLLVARPDQMATVGKAAAKMPDGFAKDFIPQAPEVKEKVLWATELLYPGETADLRFTAPEEPGDYPYLCTFPGHWRTMNGVMKVTSPPTASITSN